jgi:hypothetical protein
VRELVENAGVGKGFGAAAGSAIGDDPAYRLSAHEGYQGIKVARCHKPVPEVEVRLDRAHVVYIYRDPRDVLVSVMAQAARPFHQVMPKRLTKNSWSERFLRNDKYWTSFPGVIVSRYEQVVKFPGIEIARLASRLGLDTSVAFIESLVEKYARENVQANKVMSELTDTGWAIGQGGTRPFFTNHITSSGEWGQ